MLKLMQQEMMSSPQYKLFGDFGWGIFLGCLTNTDYIWNYMPHNCGAAEGLMFNMILDKEL